VRFLLDPSDWTTACGLAWLFEIVGATFVAICTMPPEARDFLAFRIAAQVSHGVSPEQVWQEFPRHIADAYAMSKERPRIIQVH